MDLPNSCSSDSGSPGRIVGPLGVFVVVGSVVVGGGSV